MILRPPCDCSPCPRRRAQDMSTSSKRNPHPMFRFSLHPNLHKLAVSELTCTSTKTKTNTNSKTDASSNTNTNANTDTDTVTDAKMY